VRLQAGASPYAGGVAALYSGAAPSAVARFLHGAAYLPAYVAIKHALHDCPPFLAVLCAATGATLATSLVEVPLEALFIRVKSGGLPFSVVAQHALCTSASRAALFHGAAPYVLRHAVYEAAEFAAYEHLRVRALNHCAKGPATLPVTTAAAIAAASACAATLASHPLDVVRVACSLHGSGGGAALSMRAAAAALMRLGGHRAFAKGLLPRLAATVPGSVVFFTAWETARGALASSKCV